MIQTENNYVATVNEIEPASLAHGDGWRKMDIRWIVTSALSGVEGFTIFRTVFPPGAAHERHYHPHADEFLYVISGRAAIGAEDEESLAASGTVQVIPRGRIHWLRNLDESEPVELVGGYIGGGSLEEAGYVYVGDITAEFQKVS